MFNNNITGISVASYKHIMMFEFINTCTYCIIPVHTFGYRAGVIVTADINKPDAEVKTLSP